MEKRTRLGIRMAWTMTACVLLLAAALNCAGFFSFRKSFRNFYSNKAQSVSRMLAHLVDGDKMKEYLETRKPDRYYEELNTLLVDMEKESGAAYIYIYYPMQDSFIYILDAHEEGEVNANHLGDIYQYGKMERRYLMEDAMAKRASTELMLGEDTGYGEGVYAWAPILDSEGELAAMLEVDYFTEEVRCATIRYALAFMGVAAAGTLFILLFLLASNNKMLTEPLQKITDIMLSYQNESTRLDENAIRTGDEIQILYEAFLQMTREMDEYIRNLTKITAEKERIGAELRVATKIQADMLPCIFPPFPERPEFDIYAFMVPAKEVGGDFYDFFLVDEDHLALVIADVSGKGVPAALFMAISKSLIKSEATTGLSPGKTLEKVNDQLCVNNETGMFVTVWLGILEISTGKLVCANAGHEYPVIKRNNKDYELYKDKHGFVLAGMEGTIYREYEIWLERGEQIFVYTDGVAEATDGENQLYGTDRLIAALNQHKEVSCKTLLEAVHEDIRKFVGKTAQFDDITMLCLKLNS